MPTKGAATCATEYDKEYTAMYCPRLKSLERFIEKEIRPIELFEENDIYWFIIDGTTVKKTKNGKEYLLVSALGSAGKPMRMYVWGWRGKPPDKWSVCMANVEKGDFGFTTNLSKFKEFKNE